MGEQIERASEGAKKFVDPLFFKKTKLSGVMEAKMQAATDEFKRAILCTRRMFDEAIGAFKVREQAHIQRSSENLEAAKEQNARSIEVSLLTRWARPGTQGALRRPADEAQGELFYKEWYETLRNYAEDQRTLIKTSMDKWLSFLDECGDTELLSEPNSNEQSSPSWDIFWYGIVIVLCGINTLLVYNTEDAEECNNEPLTCFHDKVMGAYIKIYDSYLAFHNITIEYENATELFNHENATELFPIL